MKKNIFQNARIKLTAYYVGVMLVVLTVFTAALIYAVDYNLNQNLSGGIISENQEGAIEKTEDMIEFSIYYIDAILLLVVGYFSYFLAGKTLKPIKRNTDNQTMFFTNVSHDLRTPIAIITTESQVALNKISNNENDFRGVVESNLEEAQKISKLVNDLLLISRGENEKVSDHLAWWNNRKFFNPKG